MATCSLWLGSMHPFTPHYPLDLQSTLDVTTPTHVGAQKGYSTIMSHTSHIRWDIMEGKVCTNISKNCDVMVFKKKLWDHRLSGNWNYKSNHNWVHSLGLLPIIISFSFFPWELVLYIGLLIWRQCMQLLAILSLIKTFSSPKVVLGGPTSRDKDVNTYSIMCKSIYNIIISWQGGRRLILMLGLGGGSKGNTP